MAAARLRPLHQSDEVARAAPSRSVCWLFRSILKKAIGGDDEAEAIHQLARLDPPGSRRDRICSSPACRASGRERMLKTLHKLRHVAGQVRDCDVQRERFKRHANRKLPQKPPFVRSSRSRHHARKRLKNLRRRLRHKRSTAGCKSRNYSLEKIRLAQKTFTHGRFHSTVCRTLAANELTTVLSSAFITCPKPESNLRDFDNLHQLAHRW